MGPLKKPNHKAKLSIEFHKDVSWWLAFLPTFNGRTVILREIISNVQLDASTIASGICFRHDWAHVNWEIEYPLAKDLHINFKEVLSVYFAALRWCHLWSNTLVLIHTDSTTAKSIINKGTCKHPLVMTVLRHLF